MHISWLLLMLFAVPGAIAGLVFGIRALVRRGGPTVPSCGECGYAVQGLTTFNCPECGSDLREVGIRTPGAGTFNSFALLATAWVVALLIFGGMGLQLLGSVVPYAARAHQQRVIFSHAPYLNVTVRASSEFLTTGGVGQRRAAPVSAPVRLRLDNPSGPELVLTRPARSSEAAIVAWLSQSGHSSNDARVADRVHDIAQCIDEMTQAASVTSFSHPNTQVTAHPAHVMTISGGATWFRVVYAIGWLALLVVGLLWLRRRTGAGVGATVGVPVAIGLTIGLLLLFAV